MACPTESSAGVNNVKPRGVMRRVETGPRELPVPRTIRVLFVKLLPALANALAEQVLNLFACNDPVRSRIAKLGLHTARIVTFFEVVSERLYRT